MARKGTAKVKPPKSVFLTDSESDHGDEEFGLDGTAREGTKDTRTVGEQIRERNAENVDPYSAREQQNLPKAPKQSRAHGRQPRQERLLAVEQSKTLALDLFPPIEDTEQLPTLQSPQRQKQRPKNKKPGQQQSSASSSHTANAGHGSRTQTPSPLPVTHLRQRQDTRPYTSFYYDILEENVDMAIPGGAAIPANQQRNMRACMVCSIVRTQQQFMTSGCPNCEDILELAGNSEQVNDCTSQVFEGLITVADTKKSWVARYQRLEGYVPGVYATQVEGILPEEVIVAVENAGINYVPRDGSEQEMLPKD